MPETPMGFLVTRKITAADAVAAAKLSGELGYPVSPELMQQRIESLAHLADHAVYVACLSEEVIGWIHVSETCHLVSEARAEISGLVVWSHERGHGVGRHLLACAESWAFERGLKGVLVRSRVEREAAHRFYLREGYARIKTSAVLTKQLG